MTPFPLVPTYAKTSCRRHDVDLFGALFGSRQTSREQVIVGLFDRRLFAGNWTRAGGCGFAVVGGRLFRRHLGLQSGSVV